MCFSVVTFEEFRGDDRSDCQWTGLTGLGLEMPRNEGIGFQLTLTDGGNVEIYSCTGMGLVIF